jgi:hypothetical protein
MYLDTIVIDYLGTTHGTYSKHTSTNRQIDEAT